MKQKQDKKVTFHQATEILHDYYDDLERASLVALERALKDTLGIGSTRFARVKEAYLSILGEEAEKMAEEMRKRMRRRIGK
jgi:F420-0:gamma-glutamyl ligase-like protein